MPEQLKTIEKNLRRNASKGDIQGYLDVLGEGMVELTKKVIELDNKISVLSGEKEENVGSLSVKERKKVEGVRLRFRDLLNRVEELERFKNELGRVNDGR